jgi:ferredoxin
VTAVGAQGERVRSRRGRRGRAATAHVALDRGLCEACWQCIDACPNAVLGRVKFGPHRHAIVRSPDDCTGCLACVKACESGALTRLSKT